MHHSVVINIKRFSKLLEDVIEDYHTDRLQAMEALEKIKDISTKFVTHTDTDDDTPSELKRKDMARRYYGCVCEPGIEYKTGNEKPGTKIALQIVERIARHKIRDWRTNPDAINRMRSEIDDIIFEIAEEYGLTIPLEEHDAMNILSFSSSDKFYLSI